MYEDKNLMRKIQLVELETLIEIDRICRKHNINYSIYGGTLLGAIRHGGFIPWDDDIDLTMTRSEYERLLEVCKTELDDSRFFFQEYRTDPYYRWGHAKIRRKDTTYIRAGQEHMKYMNGVPIDIMVADNVPDGKLMREIHCKIRFLLRKISYTAALWPHLKNPVTRFIVKGISKIPKSFFFGIRDKIAAHYNKKPTELMYCMMVAEYNKDTKYGLPAYYFDEYIELEFEGMKFKSFKNYEDYLRLVYGDYMQLPPEDKRKGNAPASHIECMELDIEDLRKIYYQGIKQA